MTLKGFDISSHQYGINVAGLAAADFLIVKATEGNNYTNPYYREWTDTARAAGKLTGAYLYVHEGTPYEQAKRFIDTVKPDLGKSLLAIDAEEIEATPSVVEAIAQYIRQQTGVTPLVYCSAARTGNYCSKWTLTHCPLWVASWGKNPENRTDWATGSGPSVNGASVALWQFSSRFHTPGYTGNLDANLCYVAEAEWNRLAAGEGKTASARKTVAQLATEVIAGKWGNGADRKKRLEAAGYDYASVQAEVNRRLK